MASWLDPLLSDLRDHCEHTGLQVVILTTDARPEHGKGPLVRAHFYRDARVRSFLGDAARYHCHVRYQVDSDTHGRPTGVVLWKDEAEGLVGRILA